MNLKTRTRKLAAALAVAGLATGSAVALSDKLPPAAVVAAAAPAGVANKAPAGSPAAAQHSAAQPSVATAGLPELTALVERNTPAVVQLTVRGKANRDVSMQIPEELRRGPFGEFFRRFGDPRGLPAPDRQGIGSGFVIGSDGYIVTNRHVVDGADTVTVRLSDRRELEAKVVGTDEQTDVALLKVEATGLPTVALGDSDALKVGQWVVAIGAPFGLERTATQGIVSALGRSLPDEQYVPFIQTDAAINPGNSGGPLFDLNGRVVGINSQIYSRTGGYMGMSFAIPINTAMNVVEQLKTTGTVSRGWLGLATQRMSQELAKSFGTDSVSGALVASVNEDSPAAKAGVKPGDIIVSFDGRRVSDSGDLAPIVGTTKPGKRVTMSVLRDGRKRDLAVVVGTHPDARKPKLASAAASAGDPVQLNVTVADLTAEQKREIGVDGGVRVVEVEDGAARAAGVRPGDVLLSIGGREVTSVEQLRTLVKDLPAGRRVPILVKREDAQLFLALAVPASAG